MQTNDTNSYTVEFRIEGENLSPLDVTQTIGLSPCLTSDSNPVKKIPFWSYDGISTEEYFVDQEWNSLDDGLDFILDKLLAKKKLIDDKFCKYKRYLYCGAFQTSFEGSIVFSPALLEKLANFNCDLIINNYFSET